MPDPRTLLRRRPLLALIILLVLLGIGYGTRALGGDGSPSVNNSTVNNSTSVVPKSGSLIPLSSLPTQARQTVILIRRGGPYPNREDGAVFTNAERQLPIQPDGYYHEYTVATPGASDRGARRIVTGGAGQFYYTADHYDSFVSVNVNQ
jgi:ribonuclease T1